MRILVVKTSSLGDVIHTLPAITDAYRVLPDIQFDWVIEESFAEIPALHPAVKRVIPLNFRHWRKQPFQAWRSSAWRVFQWEIRRQYYDLIIDAQGLLKSAFIASQAKGIRCGLDWWSAREPLASLSYHRRYTVPKEQHAITRVRQLFAAALGYKIPDDPPDYGLKLYAITTLYTTAPTLIFLHGTTWQSNTGPSSFGLN